MSDELKICEHVNGTYQRCPYCSAVNVLDENYENYEPQVIKNAENYKLADDSEPQIIAIGEKHELAANGNLSAETVISADGHARNDTEMTDSRERLESDVRWQIGHFFAWDEKRKELVGYVLGWLDRQSAITERELCGRCSTYAMAKDYLDTIDSLTAERDHFRKHVNWLIDLIADIARKQPHTFDPEAPYETLDTIGDYLDELHGNVASLTAERDGLRKQLAEKQRVIDVQRDSFAKMERECAELRQMLSDVSKAI